MVVRSRALTVAAWFAASRAIILAIGVVGVATFVNHRAVAGGAPATSEAGYTTNSVAALNPEIVWHKWDALWYERVARDGYGHELDTPAGQAVAGFWPLYPLTVRAVWALVPSISFFWVASVVSALLTLAALLLLARSLIDRDEMVGRVMAIMMTSAGSFYLTIPYAESLFLLLVVATLVMTRRRRYEIAGLLAGLAATTRVQGLALVAVPVIACWLDRELASGRRRSRAAVAAALFVIPVAMYFAGLAQAQGSWDAFVARQAMWDNPSPWPGTALLALVQHPGRISGWLHGGFWALYLGLLVRYWKRMPLGEALFCLGTFVVSTQQDSFHGVYRYMVPLVPLTLALAEDTPALHRRMIAINLVFGVLMILAFVTWNRLAV
jgi:hypothetical protein